MAPKKKTKKYLFITKQRVSYGVSYGLMNSARFSVELLNTLPGIEAKLVDCADANGIDKEIHDFKPNTVVLEALWAAPSKIEELAAKYTRVKFITRLHSNPVFLANEGMASEWIAELTALGIKTERVFVSSNDSEYCEVLESAYSQAVPYTPNHYPVVDRESHNPFDDGWTHVALMGAIRPMKNHLTQALAVLEFGKRHNLRIALHINADRVEQRGEPVLKNLIALFESTPNSKLIEHPWYPHEEFIHLMSRMHIGMQVSLTETFNIVAADLVSVGVPTVGCPDITWLPDELKANPSSVRDIVNHLDAVWNYDRQVLAQIQREHLRVWNAQALEAWKQFVRQY